MGTRESIRVMIVDDHLMVRDGLKVFLSLHDDLDVVAEAGSGGELLAMVTTAVPDVILMDMVMPEMDGPEAIARVREVCPAVQVIALTSFEEQDLVRRAIAAGAIGFLFKDVHADKLAQAIRDAHHGRATIDANAAQALVPATGPEMLLGADLTRRERDVMALLVEGMTNRAIGETLSISNGTVRLHVSNILSKLHVSNRTEAVSVALQNDLV
jgi:NarL family two-component system response regulator LiaR